MHSYALYAQFGLSMWRLQFAPDSEPSQLTRAGDTPRDAQAACTA